MGKVVILMKSGREIMTTQDWEQVKDALNENRNDDEFVIEEVILGPGSKEIAVWTSVRKSEIEGFRNI